MEQLRLREIIEQATVSPTILNLEGNNLTSLPESIGDLTNLTILRLNHNKLTSLPESIGNLTKLSRLYLNHNELTSLPESISNLTNLIWLDLDDNKLTSLPKSIDNLTNLIWLYLKSNKLTSLPESIGNLNKLILLNLDNNKLTSLPESISDLTNLNSINLDNNPLVNLSILRKLPNLNDVEFLNTNLPRRYWTKFSEWKSRWLLDEDNAQIRSILIELLGYQKICDELNAVALDDWREYTLLKIDGLNSPSWYRGINREPMVLLKMICPSTGHIHILQVPPEMKSAEQAITWINHGIHPDQFTVQT